MPVPTIDGELYSEAGFVWTGPSEKYPLGRWVAPPGAKTPGIGAVGAPAYCEHPSTEVLTVSYDLVDGRGIRRWKPGEVLPWDLMNHLTDPTAPIEAHNALFERLWVEKVAARLYGWPVPDPSKWRCSMATALVAQRPAALGNLGEVLGLTEKKDKEGDRLIKKFCIPQQPIVGLVDKKTGRVKRPDQPARRIYPHDDPEDFEKLRAYCDQDVRTEMAAMERLPPLSDRELEAWQSTTAQNYLGLGVDRAGLRDCINILNQVLQRYGQECRDLTGLEITQLEKLKGWLAAHGIYTNSLDAEHLEELIARPDIVGLPRRVLELRERTGSASVKKTLAIEAQCSADNRLRDIVVHHGTRPGRPTGSGPQPLNLPKAGPKLAWCRCKRPSLPAPTCPWCGEIQPPAPRTAWQSDMVDHVLEIMSFGSLDMVEQFYGDAMTAIQGCVRGLFQASPGNMLVSTDYSSLQAVVLACLSGEQWRIDAFRRNDPIYLLGASKITGKPLQFYLDWFLEHGDHHPDRQYIGKVSELACLSPETQVLTDRGYVAIEDVLSTDRLWDGLEWVSHLGLIEKGVRTVVSLDGVRITPDHLVLSNGSWMAAEQLVSNESIRSRALATGSENLPSWTVGSIRFTCGALAALTPTRSNGRTSSAASPPAATLALKKRLARLVRAFLGMRIFARTWRIVVAFLTESLLASLVVAPAMRLRTPKTTQGEESGFTTPGETGPRGGGLSSHTSSPSTGGIDRLSNWIVSKLTAITSRVIFASSRGKRTCSTSDQSETCKPCSTSTSLVYDIANAGPRNRFTIKTDSGHLIVHNCGFQGWIGSYRAFGSVEEDSVIRQQILAWRDASPAIVEMWGGQHRGPPWRRERAELYGLEGMFIAAVQNPGQYFDYRGIGFLYDLGTDCLEMLLPPCDGHRRPLRYHEPRLTPSARNPDELAISYMTWNTNVNYGARGWVRMPTWGGRLTENAVMGVEVDIQRYGAKLMAAAGYPLVLTVYDENVAEIPVGKPLTLGLPPVDGLDPYVQEIEHLLAIMPPELADWPIRASGGWRGKRYRKA